MRAFGALLGLGAALWLIRHWVILSPFRFACLWLVEGLNCGSRAGRREAFEQINSFSQAPVVSGAGRICRARAAIPALRTEPSGPILPTGAPEKAGRA